MIRNILGSLLLLCTIFVTTTASAQDQAKIDDDILKAYFAKNKIKATKTASGLYYVIHKKGTGENAKASQQVGVNYLGRFLDDKRFDGNIDENWVPVPGRSVLTFTLGVGQVIRGWDEGIALLNTGSRGTIYIPSALAYGPGGRPGIPPNAILKFEVELVSK